MSSKFGLCLRAAQMDERVIQQVLEDVIAHTFSTECPAAL